MKLRWVFLVNYMLHKIKWINHYVMQFIRYCGGQFAFWENNSIILVKRYPTKK